MYLKISSDIWRPCLFNGQRAWRRFGIIGKKGPPTNHKFWKFVSTPSKISWQKAKSIWYLPTLPQGIEWPLSIPCAKPSSCAVYWFRYDCPAFRVCSIIHTVLVGFFKYMAQMITSMKRSIEHNEFSLWPLYFISPRSFRYEFKIKLLKYGTCRRVRSKPCTVLDGFFLSQIGFNILVEICHLRLVNDQFLVISMTMPQTDSPIHFCRNIIFRFQICPVGYPWSKSYHWIGHHQGPLLLILINFNPTMDQ